MRLFGTGRAAGGWGIVFVVILLISAAMVSLPTGAETGTKIATFYKAHGRDRGGAVCRVCPLDRAESVAQTRGCRVRRL